MRFSFGRGRQEGGKLPIHSALNNFPAGASSQPSAETDDISPLTPVSPHDLFPTAKDDKRTELKEQGLPSINDTISPLEPNLPWSDPCWSDATTASAVLSLLQKKPMTGLSNSAGEFEQVRNPTRATCSVCFEAFEPEQFPDAPIAVRCDHTSMPSTHICTTCLSRSLDIQLSDSRTDRLSCPLCHAPLSDSEVERWASKPTSLAYDLARTRRMLEQDAEFVTCINPDCGSGQIHVGGGENPIVVCGACGTRTCFVHREAPWHRGLTCAEYEAVDLAFGYRVPELPGLLGISFPRQGESPSLDYLSQRTIQETTRACPGCGVATEKVGGCKYMRCGMCWKEWCWECGIYWSRGHLSVDCSALSDERRTS
ncbi:hypothetical protein BJX61DRAFT_193691 [Aspergillus egyptiacus]|nr:hypothetical protein BJX61DRAFT_193691 [Aspergillus egyptiacus]